MFIHIHDYQSHLHYNARIGELAAEFSDFVFGGYTSSAGIEVAARNRGITFCVFKYVFIRSYVNI